MFYLCSKNFYYFVLYHSSALEFYIERYISIVYYYYYYYLQRDIHSNLRSAFSKLRLSSHRFMVERRRWRKPKVQYIDRKCTLCNDNDIQDEYYIVGTQWKEPARGCLCYELMSSTNALQPFPPSGASVPKVELSIYTFISKIMIP